MKSSVFTGLVLPLLAAGSSINVTDSLPSLKIRSNGADGTKSASDIWWRYLWDGPDPGNYFLSAYGGKLGEYKYYTNDHKRSAPFDPNNLGSNMPGDRQVTFGTADINIDDKHHPAMVSYSHSKNCIDGNNVQGDCYKFDAKKSKRVLGGDYLLHPIQSSDKKYWVLGNVVAGTLQNSNMYYNCLTGSGSGLFVGRYTDHITAATQGDFSGTPCIQFQRANGASFGDNTNF